MRAKHNEKHGIIFERKITRYTAIKRPGKLRGDDDGGHKTLQGC